MGNNAKQSKRALQSRYITKKNKKRENKTTIDNEEKT